jgi:outer membrane protein OmpA-like peptidoglycan-associated protein
MKKTILLCMAALTTMGAQAQQYDDPLKGGKESDSEEISPLTPSYLENAYSNGMDSNWFLAIKGGITTFAGNPTGCGDIFDRIEPLINVSFGKWLTPKVGARLVYQGPHFKDCNLQAKDYSAYHFDLMYNVAEHFRKGIEVLPRWDFVPYLGAGVLKHHDLDYSPFALSYGMMVQYRLGKRLHLSAEVGNSTTWQNFDGVGSSDVLGDHLLQASAGLSLTIGKVGWHKVIDPMPYIYQNDKLMERLSTMKKENQNLQSLHMKDAYSLAEMRKILEIEGLLDKYELTQQDGSIANEGDSKSYSGINALRARLRNKKWNGDIDNYQPKLKEGIKEEKDSTDLNDFFHLMQDGKIYIGSPIFFFFQINTDRLTEKAQIINIKQIASTMKKYSLHARVIGAADSQTGTAYRNEQLSAKRAEYIANILIKNGVQADRITKQHQGGISKYVPAEGNRNSCVMLYFK